MSNQRMRVNLLALEGAKVAQKNGSEYVVIPIKDADLYKGSQGVYLNLVAWGTNNSQYGDTHYIKQDLSKERRDAMPEAERKRTPILGNVKPVSFSRQGAENPQYSAGANTDSNVGSNDSDLPF